MTTRLYTIYADKNPDTEEGVGLAEKLGLNPDDCSDVMGRPAFEIKIPFDENAAIASERMVDETLAQFRALGYGCEEKS